MLFRLANKLASFPNTSVFLNLSKHDSYKQCYLRKITNWNIYSYGQTNMKTPAKLLLFAENVLKSSENEVANP